MSEIVRRPSDIDGDLLSPDLFRGLLLPMGDGPYPRGVWEPWKASMEAAGGITLGTDDHTESFCRLSGYLRPVAANARRLCACWNAFIGIQTHEIERIAKERSGWNPPNQEAMWEWPERGQLKNITK